MPIPFRPACYLRPLCGQYNWRRRYDSPTCCRPLRRSQAAPFESHTQAKQLACSSPYICARYAGITTGGDGTIRTYAPFLGRAGFEPAAIDHSATSPKTMAPRRRIELLTLGSTSRRSPAELTRRFNLAEGTGFEPVNPNWSYGLANRCNNRSANLPNKSITWRGQCDSPTSCRPLRRSQAAAIGLSAISPKTWCRLQDSNPRPAVYKTAALPAELLRRTSLGKREIYYTHGTPVCQECSEH